MFSALRSRRPFRKQLLLHVVKAQPRDRIGEAFAGDALLAEKEDRLFDHIEHLVLVREDLVKIRRRATFLPHRPPI